MKMKLAITLAAALCTAAWYSPAENVPEHLGGSYQIRNCKFGELLRPENANNADGTPIVLYSPQPWKCMTWKLLPAGDSAYHLRNHFTSKTFAVQTNGKEPLVVQVPFAGDASKRSAWLLTRLPDGFYRISEKESGKALTASSKHTVILAPWEKKSEQEWELQAIDPAKLTM